MEGINGTPKIQGWYYKMGKQQTMRGIQPQSIEVKILKKTLLEIQKERKKRENSVRDPQTATRKHTWIQGDSNFTSLKSLKSHPTL